ncbi:hypothetical protein DRQ09_08580 [candidate division KSB1 bacterium]|nr:MAG: hypothetical protein DRQ09_08580 [candidate division KSB1 bacterium]
MEGFNLSKIKDLERERKLLKETIERLNRKFDDKVKELSLIRRISDSLIHALNIKKVCIELVKIVIDEINAENCSLMLYDRGSRKLVLRAAKGQMDEKVRYFEKLKANGKGFKIGEGIAGIVAKNKKTIRVVDTKTDERFINHRYNSENIGSILCLPLIFKGKIIGVFNLSHPEKYAFSEEDERILTIIANQAAIVMSTVLPVEELKISNQRLKEALGKLKKAEKMLEEYSKNLEKMVEEKTVELRESEEKYRNLFEDANDGIITLDLDYHITSVNRKFEEILSKCRKELIGKPIFDVLEVVDTGENFLDKMKDITEKNMPFSYEIKIQTPTGIKILDINSSYMFYRDKLEGIQQIYRDVTEKKLLQNQLIQSEKLASIGELVSGVAHELNNPLSIISGYSELLKKDKELSKKHKKKIDKINKAVNRGIKIVENLLSFAREKPLEMKKINIQKIIEKTIEIRDYELKVNNIKVIRDFQEDLEETYGDPYKLQQVFLNLINNSYDAIKKTKKKGIIKIKTYSSKGNIIVEFIDDGPGIPEEIQDKIFDPFFTTKEIGEGTGLGLSLSYGIIKNHNGSISLDTAFLEGTKFVIKLPIIKEKPPGKKEPCKFTGDIKKVKRILVVDDEESILELSREILETEGYVVDTADTGRKAQKLIEKFNYDVVISDIKIPGEIGGKELYLFIRSIKPELIDKVVFITGDKISPDTRQFLSEVNNPYIDKPFKIKTYLNTIRKILSKK